LSAHVFVDESKFRGYLLAAAIVPAADLTRLRKLVESLRMPRQRRIHFTTESDSRRKLILSRLAEAGTHAEIYDASGYARFQQARDAAMTCLVDDAAKAGTAMLVIECDDQAVSSDRAIIRARAERAGCLDTFRYAHKRAHEECLLAIPDAMAWAKGGKGRLLW
jgi:hypothetical protein